MLSTRIYPKNSLFSFLSRAAFVCAILTTACSGGGGGSASDTGSSGNNSSGKLYFSQSVNADNTFTFLTTTSDASESLAGTGSLNADGSVKSVTSFMYEKKSGGENHAFRIDFDASGMPSSVHDRSSGGVIYLSGYSNGVVHARVVDTNGATQVEDVLLTVNHDDYTNLASLIAARKSGDASSSHARQCAITSNTNTLQTLAMSAGLIVGGIGCGTLAVTTATATGPVAPLTLVEVGVACTGLVVNAAAAVCSANNIDSGLCTVVTGGDFGFNVAGCAMGDELGCLATVAQQMVGQSGSCSDEAGGGKKIMWTVDNSYGGIHMQYGVELWTCAYPLGPWKGSYYNVATGQQAGSCGSSVTYNYAVMSSIPEFVLSDYNSINKAIGDTMFSTPQTLYSTYQGVNNGAFHYAEQMRMALALTKGNAASAEIAFSGSTIDVYNYGVAGVDQDCHSLPSGNSTFSLPHPLGSDTIPVTMEDYDCN